MSYHHVNKISFSWCIFILVTIFHLYLEFSSMLSNFVSKLKFHFMKLEHDQKIQSQMWIFIKSINSHLNDVFLHWCWTFYILIMNFPCLWLIFNWVMNISSKWWILIFWWVLIFMLSCYLHDQCSSSR